MYMFGKAVGIARSWGGYKVIIQDKQVRTYECELVDDEYRDCLYATEEDARKEVERYNALSWVE